MCYLLLIWQKTGHRSLIISHVDCLHHPLCHFSLSLSLCLLRSRSELHSGKQKFIKQKIAERVGRVRSWMLALFSRSVFSSKQTHKNIVNTILSVLLCGNRVSERGSPQKLQAKATSVWEGEIERGSKEYVWLCVCAWNMEIENAINRELMASHRNRSMA